MQIKLFEDYDLNKLEKKVNIFLKKTNFVADISHNVIKKGDKILYTCIVVFNTQGPKMFPFEIKPEEAKINE